MRFGLLLGGVLLVAATTGIASAESLCGPFDEAYSLAAAEPLAADPGITTGSDGGDRPRSPGRIVELADAAEDGASSDPRPAEGSDDATGSEAILALPKDETGALPTDFELGPGARIRQSFFSPVVCATIAVRLLSALRQRTRAPLLAPSAKKTTNAAVSAPVRK